MRGQCNTSPKWEGGVVGSQKTTRGSVGFRSIAFLCMFRKSLRVSMDGEHVGDPRMASCVEGLQILRRKGGFQGFQGGVNHGCLELLQSLRTQLSSNRGHTRGLFGNLASSGRLGPLQVVSRQLVHLVMLILGSTSASLGSDQVGGFIFQRG